MIPVWYSMLPATAPVGDVTAPGMTTFMSGTAFTNQPLQTWTPLPPAVAPAAPVPPKIDDEATPGDDVLDLTEDKEDVRGAKAAKEAEPFQLMLGLRFCSHCRQVAYCGHGLCANVYCEPSSGLC